MNLPELQSLARECYCAAVSKGGAWNQLSHAQRTLFTRFAGEVRSRAMLERASQSDRVRRELTATISEMANQQRRASVLADRQAEQIEKLENALAVRDLRIEELTGGEGEA